MSSQLDSFVDRVLWSLIAEWAISTGEAKERAAAHVNRYVSFLMTEPSIPGVAQSGELATPQSTERPSIDHSAPLGFQVRARKFAAGDSAALLAHEFATIEREAFKRGLEQRDTRPRGRKLTDGERNQLNSLVSVWRNEPTGIDSLRRWYHIEDFVESLLAPTDEVRRTLTQVERKALDALLIDWTQLDTTQTQLEFQRAKQDIFAFVDTCLGSPTDEVRVALGEVTLGFGSSCWVDVASNSLFLSSKTDDALTAALSASPGDRFEFAVCARRVGK